MDPDERYGTTIFAALNDGEPGPSTVDVMRAVIDGERHHRRVRLVGSAGAAAAVLVVLASAWTVTRPASRPSPPATQAPPSPSLIAKLSCSVQQLRTPNGQGPKAVVSGADPTGHYIVGRTYPGGRPTTVIWKDRQPTQVPMAGSDPDLYDITSTGVAVGSSFLGDKTAAWYYADGKYTRLAGGEAQALAINERRQIVGSVGDKPVLWRTPGDQPRTLALPGPQWTGTAMGIDDDGTIVGAVAPTKDGVRVGALWRPDGTFEQLSAPNAHGGPAGEYVAKSIRDGWVVGWAAFDRGQTRYIGEPLWNLGAGTRRDRDGFAEAVNAHGWFVGGRTLIAGDEEVVLPVPKGFEKQPVLEAYTISDDGSTIAGQAATLNGGVANQPVPVVWTCRR
jgi:hypothetical protein